MRVLSTMLSTRSLRPGPAGGNRGVCDCLPRKLRSPYNMGCGASHSTTASAHAAISPSGNAGHLGSSGGTFSLKSTPSLGKLLAINKAKTVGKKMRLEADARAMATILGGVSIGKIRQSSAALHILRDHYRVRRHFLELQSLIQL